MVKSNIFWAGSDENEFFYMPQAWVKDVSTPEEYINSLTPEQVRILCDGEQSLITRHKEAISQIEKAVMKGFDPDATGEIHGPDHWDRVCQHGHAIARSLGIDPLIPHVFGWVHDSQREDDDVDRDHGPRAAAFLTENRGTLFKFLSDDQLTSLVDACNMHSEGDTEGSAEVRACWVGIPGDRDH